MEHTYAIQYTDDPSIYINVITTGTSNIWKEEQQLDEHLTTLNLLHGQH